MNENVMRLAVSFASWHIEFKCQKNENYVWEVSWHDMATWPCGFKSRIEINVISNIEWYIVVVSKIGSSSVMMLRTCFSESYDMHVDRSCGMHPRDDKDEDSTHWLQCWQDMSSSRGYMQWECDINVGKRGLYRIVLPLEEQESRPCILRVEILRVYPPWVESLLSYSPTLLTNVRHTSLLLSIFIIHAGRPAWYKSIVNRRLILMSRLWQHTPCKQSCSWCPNPTVNHGNILITPPFLRFDSETKIAFIPSRGCFLEIMTL